MPEIAHKIDSSVNGVKRSADIQIADSKLDFQRLGLAKSTLDGLRSAGFVRPSPIQMKAIPVARLGLDLVVQAKSGTGKTCVFVVAALEAVDAQSKYTQVLVLAPTREIADQIQSVVDAISSARTGLRIGRFIGGTSLSVDMKGSRACHIAIGTPGRVTQLVQGGSLDLSHLKLLVLDEADQLVNETFADNIAWLMTRLPVSPRPQVLVASATYPRHLEDLLKEHMQSPTVVRSSETAAGSDVQLIGVKQFATICHPSSHANNDTGTVAMARNADDIPPHKLAALHRVLSEVNFSQCLIFCNKQSRAEAVSLRLRELNWPTDFISASLAQSARLSIINKLKKFSIRILVTTDLTARGIDASNVNLVINFDVPYQAETYFHRIGRSGRYGSYGAAVTILASSYDETSFSDMIRAHSLNIKQLPENSAELDIINDDTVWQTSAEFPLAPTRRQQSFKNIKSAPAPVALQPTRPQQPAPLHSRPQIVYRDFDDLHTEDSEPVPVLSSSSVSPASTVSEENGMPDQLVSSATPAQQLNNSDLKQCQLSSSSSTTQPVSYSTAQLKALDCTPALERRVPPYSFRGKVKQARTTAEAATATYSRHVLLRVRELALQSCDHCTSIEEEEEQEVKQDVIATSEMAVDEHSSNNDGDEPSLPCSSSSGASTPEPPQLDEEESLVDEETRNTMREVREVVRYTREQLLALDCVRMLKRRVPASAYKARVKPARGNARDSVTYSRHVMLKLQDAAKQSCGHVRCQAETPLRTRLSLKTSYRPGVGRALLQEQCDSDASVDAEPMPEGRPMPERRPLPEGVPLQLSSLSPIKLAKAVSSPVKSVTENMQKRTLTKIPSLLDAFKEPTPEWLGSSSGQGSMENFLPQQQVFIPVTKLLDPTHECDSEGCCSSRVSLAGSMCMEDEENAGGRRYSRTDLVKIGHSYPIDEELQRRMEEYPLSCINRRYKYGRVDLLNLQTSEASELMPCVNAECKDLIVNSDDDEEGSRVFSGNWYGSKLAAELGLAEDHTCGGADGDPSHSTCKTCSNLNTSFATSNVPLTPVLEASGSMEESEEYRQRLPSVCSNSSGRHVPVTSLSTEAEEKKSRLEANKAALQKLKQLKFSSTKKSTKSAASDEIATLSGTFAPNAKTPPKEKVKIEVPSQLELCQSQQSQSENSRPSKQDNQSETKYNHVEETRPIKQESRPIKQEAHSTLYESQLGAILAPVSRCPPQTSSATSLSPELLDVLQGRTDISHLPRNAREQLYREAERQMTARRWDAAEAVLAGSYRIRKGWANVSSQTDAVATPNEEQSSSAPQAEQSIRPHRLDQASASVEPPPGLPSPSVPTSTDCACATYMQDLREYHAELMRWYQEAFMAQANGWDDLVGYMRQMMLQPEEEGTD